MKKPIILGLLLGTLPANADGSNSDLQLIENVIKEIEGKNGTTKSVPTKIQTAPQQLPNRPIEIVPTTMPQPMRLPAAPQKSTVKEVKAITKPAPAAPTEPTNPSVNILNTTPNTIVAFTAPSLEDDAGEFGQTSLSINSYSSIQLNLTSHDQRAIGIQIPNQGIVTDNLPITLKTPWAIVDASLSNNTTLHYLPSFEQNSIILINPYNIDYTVRILNKFAEDINIEESVNQKTDTPYLILEMQLPAHGSITLPVTTTPNVRLHIFYKKKNQNTRINYPTAPGFYVIQEVQQELIPRSAFRTGIYTSGVNSNRYLYVQQIDA